MITRSLEPFGRALSSAADELSPAIEYFEPEKSMFEMRST
jgi:hypothetical protein